MDHSMHDMSSMGGGSDYNPDAASGGGGSMMMMMQMYFYWSPSVTILFKSWATSDWGFYVLALGLVVLFCVLHEFITSLRLKRSVSRRCRAKDVEKGSTEPPKPTFLSKLLDRLLLTALYALNLTFSYAIMLIVMTFNVGLFIAVILGLSIGFFCFGARGQAGADRPGMEEGVDNCCGGGATTSDACCAQG